MNFPTKFPFRSTYYGMTTALTLSSPLPEKAGNRVTAKRDRTDAFRRPGMCWKNTERANKPFPPG